jgi:hypothetical protein
MQASIYWQDANPIFPNCWQFALAMKLASSGTFASSNVQFFAVTATACLRLSQILLSGPFSAR